MMDDLGRMVTRTMVRDELMGAVERMDPDVAITPRALTEELARQTVDAMSTLGYPVHGKALSQRRFPARRAILATGAMTRRGC
jgi:hypothetical protein